MEDLDSTTNLSGIFLTMGVCGETFYPCDFLCFILDIFKTIPQIYDEGKNDPQ